MTNIISVNPEGLDISNVGKVLPLVEEDNLVLHSIANEIQLVDQETQELFDNMFATMKNVEGPGIAVGIAAPQVGVNKRMFIVDFPCSGDEPIDNYESCGSYYFVNPIITDHSDDANTQIEGCLSVIEKTGLVPRWEQVIIEGLDYYGNYQIVKAQGWLSRCFQHEMDHLDGRLFTEYLTY